MVNPRVKMTKIDNCKCFGFINGTLIKIIGKIGLILAGIYPQQCNVLGTIGDQYDPS